MPVLTVDAREQKKWHNAFKLYGAQKFPDWQVDVRLIEIGDYAHEDLIGIEHKEPGDFLSSLRSGKLFDQAYELAGAYQQGFIVVNGVPRQLWSDEYVRYGDDNIFGVLSSLAVRRKTPVLFTGSNDTHFMCQIFKLCSKTKGDGSFRYNPVRSNGSKKDRGLHLISSLPGVGPKRAHLILEHYGTPLAAITNYNRWNQDVKGIGNGTVDKCKDVLESAVDRTAPPEESVADLGAAGAREEARQLRGALSRRELGPASLAFLRAGRNGEDERGARPSS